MFGEIAHRAVGADVAEGFEEGVGGRCGSCGEGGMQVCEAGEGVVLTFFLGKEGRGERVSLEIF